MATPRFASRFHEGAAGHLGRWLAALIAAGAPSAFFAFFAACSNASPPAANDGCPSVSQSCPSPPPSWAKDVQPLIQGYCVTCHRPGGTGATTDLTTYGYVSEHSTEVLVQVYTCRMPNVDASPPPPLLSEAQRETIVAWVGCGSPNN